MSILIITKESVVHTTSASLAFCNCSLSLGDKKINFDFSLVSITWSICSVVSLRPIKRILSMIRRGGGEEGRRGGGEEGRRGGGEEGRRETR